MKLSTEVKLHKIYQIVHKHYRKIVPYDILNTNIVGALTIASFLVSGLNLCWKLFFPSLSILPSNHAIQVFIEYTRWACHIYCGYVVILAALDKILFYKTDPARILMKAIHSNMDSIMKNIDKNQDTNPFHTRRIDPDKSDDEIDNLADSLGLDDSNSQNLFDELKKCYQKRPDSISIFCIDNIDIGISGVLPMKEGREAKSHYDGHLSRFQIKSEMITSKRTNLILFHYIHLHPEYRHRFEIQQRIIACLLFKAALFMKDEEEAIIYAEASSSTCKRLLKKLGFVISPGRSSADKNHIMVLDFRTYRESDNSVYARRTIRIIKKIRRKITESTEPPSCNNFSTC